MMSSSKKQYGFSMVELLIGIGLMGLIAIFATPFILNNTNNTTEKAQLKNAASTFHGVIDLDTVKTGSYPLTHGLGKIITKDKLKAVSIQSVSFANVPAKCKVSINGYPVVKDGDIAVEFKENVIAYGLSSSWTRGEGRAGKAADRICYFPKNNPQGNPTIELFEIDDSTNFAATNGASSQSAASQSSSTQNLSTTTTSLTSTELTASTPQVAVAKTAITIIVLNAYRGPLVGANITGGPTAVVADTGGRAVINDLEAGNILNLHINQPGYDPVSEQVIVSPNREVTVYLDATPLDVVTFVAYNAGSSLHTVNLRDFLNSHWDAITGFMYYYNTFVQAMSDTLNHIYYYASIGRWDLVADSQGHYNYYASQAQYYLSQAQGTMQHYYDILNTIYSIFGGNAENAISQNVTFGNNTLVFFDRNGNIVNGNVQGFSQSVSSAGNIYTAPDGSRYRVVNGFSTPIKISLKGTIAKLDSNDDYLFDYDGFAKNKLPMVKPAGGLTPDEAWLVVDRHRNGIVNSMGIIDGDDVFGDHVHKVANGYLDMGQVFQKSLKRDSEGKLYFEVKKLPWWEEWFVIIARFFGYMKDPIAGMDLKLLDRKKHIVPAHQYLQKVYVDYWTVDEWDAKEENWIGQRAKVQFVDGHWSESADQWFKIGWRLMPLPPDKKSQPPVEATTPQP